MSNISYFFTKNLNININFQKSRDLIIKMSFNYTSSNFGEQSVSYSTSSSSAGGYAEFSSAGGASLVGSSYGGASLVGSSYGGALYGGASASSGSAATVSRIAQDMLSFSSGSASSASASAASAGADFFAFKSQVEASILAAANPLEFNATKQQTAAGQTGLWLNEAEVLAFNGNLAEYVFVEDANPQVINKKVQQQLEYVQELAIRYLRPPTPPAPGEIVIQMEGNSLSGPAPPLVIRQVPARPDTPEPLVLREAPPQPPTPVGRKLITIGGKRLPPPPRKVVIERLPQLPSKPQSVLVERWLPYVQGKRRVIFQKSGASDPVIVAPRNVIVQWEAPSVVVRKEFKYLGVIRANPAEYVAQYGASLKLASALPQFVLDIKTPEGLVLAEGFKYSSVYDLYGDVSALKLVDLAANGLSEYASFVANWTDKASGSVEAAFRAVDTNNSGSISLQEAQTMLLRLNSNLGRTYGEKELTVFFQALDTNRDGQLSLEELKRAFLTSAL